jgi:hypothetical protein
MIASQSNSSQRDCTEISKGTIGSMGGIRVKEWISVSISVEICLREKLRISKCDGIRPENCEEQIAQEKRRALTSQMTAERDKVRVLEARYVNQFVSND